MASNETTIDLTNLPDAQLAVWAALPAIVSTMSESEESVGVHVHLRRRGQERKMIDDTYDAVEVRCVSGEFRIESDALTRFSVARLLGIPTAAIRCGCGLIIDDLVHQSAPVQEHICNCGRMSLTSKEVASTPFVELQERFDTAFGARPATLHQPDELVIPVATLDGVEIWPSNPAVLFIGDRREDQGLHVHGYRRKNGRQYRCIDDTYSAIRVGNRIFRGARLRMLMAQLAGPLTATTLAEVHCSGCAAPLDAQGKDAFTPTLSHICDCGVTTQTESPVIASLAIREQQELLSELIDGRVQ